MAHIRGALPDPATDVGLDDRDRGAVDRAADRCRRAGTGRAGRRDRRVVGGGEAHVDSVGRAAEPDVNRT
jgi:hypothetical protein